MPNSVTPAQLYAMQRTADSLLPVLVTDGNSIILRDASQIDQSVLKSMFSNITVSIASNGTFPDTSYKDYI